MPAYTPNSSIPYPVGTDPIRGTLTDSILDDLKDIAVATDAADVSSEARTGAAIVTEGLRAENAAKAAANAALNAKIYVRPKLTAADNVDTVTASGFYPISSDDAPAGLPVGVTASGLWVGDLLNSTGNIQVQMIIAYNPVRMYVRDRNSAGFWQAYKTTQWDDPTKIDGGAGQRDSIVDAGIKKRGGVIGTNGLPVVALRFDHHLPNFKTKVLPLLKAKRLPWGQMLNSAAVANGSETMTYAQIATECYTSGGEVWNHSYSHASYTQEAQADREVTRGLKDLRAGLPGLQIDGWAGPGQDSMMGMEGSEAPERFWNTYPGRLVLGQHAFVRGYYPGIYQPMTGPNLVGAPHVTIDTLDPTYVSGVVRGAAAAGAGVTLMLHATYLDTPGYMTTAQLNTVLTEIETMRNAGEILVMSPTAVLLTDASSDYRRNLLTTGAAGPTTSAWTETVSGRSAQAQYGVPHELVVTVKARTAGTATLNLKEAGSSPRFDSAHSVTLTAGQVITLRCLATFPLDCAGIIATLTANVDHSDIHLHAN